MKGANISTIINLLKQAKIKEMQELNTKILESSPEYAYWVEKLNEDSEYKQLKKKNKVKGEHRTYMHEIYKMHGKSDLGSNQTYKDHQYDDSETISRTPQKNKIYCFAAKKYKSVFDSEKAANNYIKFNAKDISSTKGYAPIRSYFCSLCGGWHVTSQQPKEITGRQRSSHAEYVLSSINKMSKDNELRKEIIKQEALIAQDPSLTDSGYRTFIALYNIFCSNRLKRDIKLTIKDFRHLVAFSKKTNFNESNVNSVKKKLRKCSNYVILLAVEQDKLHKLEENDKYFIDDHKILISMLINVHKLMKTFDREFEIGNIDKCCEIFLEISKIKNKLYHISSKVAKNVELFLGEAKHKLPTTIFIPKKTEISKSYLESKIDGFISAFNEGDTETCVKIKEEFEAHEMGEYESSMNIYLSILMNFQRKNSKK